MVPELITGLGLFNTLFDTAKGLKDINDSAVRNRAVVELLEKILAAHAAQAALLERVSNLEKELASFETWDAEKQRYELADYGEGTFAYRLKESMQNGEPPHRVCASCFQKNQKSILQNAGGTHSGREQLWCPSCNSKYFFGQYKRPQPVQVRTVRSSRSWMSN